MVKALLVVLAATAAAVEPWFPPGVPPSPSTASGERIWPQPSLTHWPAVQFPDESRHVAVRIPVPPGPRSGTLGWDGAAALPIAAPDGVEECSGLLALPGEAGARTAVVTLGDRATRLPILLVDAGLPWPAARLAEGFPVTATGVPVVLVDRRRDARDRRWQPLLTADDRRPAGRAVVVGDPLAGTDGDAWEGLDARGIPCELREQPHHAAVVAFAQAFAGGDLPRTILWCPGFSLDPALVSAEEDRLLGALRTRLDALGAAPRLVLALPPLPADPARLAAARERNKRLAAAARQHRWQVLDLADAAGDPDDANRVGDGVFSPAPVGAARERVRTALRDALKP